ncbi:hypothetical protein P4O66_019911 [Electrophorus voltai]|uniref:Intersectin 2a n=1 Tax=Electrophorus voltai TaxID=2609070 RepID=A0AAD8ZUI5_9TELE|nr:hypothetical protein P4O66_019911 [Electrophorus voltai]
MVNESPIREPGWLYGSYCGNSGWFPESYAERTSEDDPPAVPAHVTAPSAGHSRPLYSTVDELDLPDPGLLEEYVALYTYESPETGDLAFQAEDVVLVMEREGEWWRGCIGDQAGLFPSNYVKPKDSDVRSMTSNSALLVVRQVSRTAGAGQHLTWPRGPSTGHTRDSYRTHPRLLQDTPTALTPSSHFVEVAQVTTACVATAAEQLSVSPGQLIVVLHKNSCGWWLGELQCECMLGVCLCVCSGEEATEGMVSLLELCQVIAMYDYKAANGDEMSFLKGQLINVLNKDDSDWWKGEVNGITGLFPTNYVKMTTESDPSQQWCADLLSLDSMNPEERKRQGYIHELIQTEQTYVQDLELVMEVFYKPMAESGWLTEAEMCVIFVNWRELIMCNTKLLKALHVRKKAGGERMPVQVIGDVLSSELPHMQAYVHFCSCQLNGAALLQRRTDASDDFKLFLKKLATNHLCRGMPLCSFLLKPMQRITRYPLLIRNQGNILENTPAGHLDQANLREALERAEDLCLQVNEGVRQKENSDRLEWLQNHVQCEGVIEYLVFNSLTNCLGPRKLLHSGRVWKTKSSRELWVFLFSDFLLLTQTSKQLVSSSDRLFSPTSSAVYKLYKLPLFLNEVLVKMPSDPSSDDPIFHISHIDRVYTLKADSINERTTWVQRIKAASEHFIETEKLKREKAYQARSQKTSGIGRLLVTVQEAIELKPCKPNGKSAPYCELSMGAQCYTSRPHRHAVNPKWNFSCHFFIKDVYQDVLCLTVFERDRFSPDGKRTCVVPAIALPVLTYQVSELYDMCRSIPMRAHALFPDFLGRTEVPVATIKKEQDRHGPLMQRLLLHEVPTGELRTEVTFHDTPSWNSDTFVRNVSELRLRRLHNSSQKLVCASRSKKSFFSH